MSRKIAIQSQHMEHWNDMWNLLKSKDTFIQIRNQKWFS